MRLGPTFARGAVLLTGVMGIQQVLAFITIAILARLVSPTEFGQAILAATVADFLMVLASLSLAAALLREPEETLGTAFKAALVLEAGIAAAVLVLSVPTALILSDLASPMVGGMFLAMMAARGFALIGHLYQALVERRLQYGRVATILLGAYASSMVAAVVVAVLGGGAWAVATRDVTISLIGFVLSVALAGRLVRSPLAWQKVRELWRFGTAMIGSRLGDLLFHRVDNVAVAAFAGSSSLGLYNQAYVLAEATNKLFVPVISYLPLNFYAKLQEDPARVQRVYDLIMFLLARIVAPIGVVFLVVPEQILTVAFGDPWAPAAGMLRGLAAYAVLLPIFEHARVLLVAYGAVGRVLFARAIQIIVFLPLVVLLTWRFGGDGAGVAVAVAMIVGTVAILWEAKAFAKFRLKDLGVPIAAGLTSATITLIVLNAHSWPAGVAVLLAAGIAVSLQLALSALFERRRGIAYVRWLINSRNAVGSPQPGMVVP